MELIKLITRLIMIRMNTLGRGGMKNRLRVQWTHKTKKEKKYSPGPKAQASPKNPRTGFYERPIMPPQKLNAVTSLRVDERWQSEKHIVRFRCSGSGQSSSSHLRFSYITSVMWFFVLPFRPVCIIVRVVTMCFLRRCLFVHVVCVLQRVGTVLDRDRVVSIRRGA